MTPNELLQSEYSIREMKYVGGSTCYQPILYTGEVFSIFYTYKEAENNVLRWLAKHSTAYDVRFAAVEIMKDKGVSF